VSSAESDLETISAGVSALWALGLREEAVAAYRRLRIPEARTNVALHVHRTLFLAHGPSMAEGWLQRLKESLLACH